MAVETARRRRARQAIAIVALATVTGLAAYGAHSLALGTSTRGTQPRVEHISYSFARLYDTWRDLRSDSRLIVIGTAGVPTQAPMDVIAQFPGHHFPSEKWCETIVTVNRTLLGAQLPAVSILQPGEPPTGDVTVVTEWPTLSPGTKYLLFLTPSPIAGQWYQVGGPMGVYPIGEDGRVKRFSDIGVPLDAPPIDQVVQAVQSAGPDGSPTASADAGTDTGATPAPLAPTATPSLAALAVAPSPSVAMTQPGSQ